MARYGRIKSRSEEDPELNMIPIMNMFMVLIPFLLMSASFFHIKAINTSVPVHADKAPDEIKDADDKKTEKITVVLEIKSNEIRISALSDTPNDLQLSSMETVLPRPLAGEISVAEVAAHLKSLKLRYPASDTMILIPDDEISYNEIIRAMDCARRYESEELFPNVVLSGSLG